MQLEPADRFNTELVRNVHPPDWTNPHPFGRYNLVVLGAGTAGLVSAAGAAGLGAKVALVERHLLGGDCLNYGCVPSKAIIRSARTAAEVARAAEWGIRVPPGSAADFGLVMERMRRLRAEISRHDAAARFRSLGVDVFLGAARFTGPQSAQVAGQDLRFSRAVIATGARAAPLDLPGADEVGYRTNETIFSLTELPRRLVVVGGGPIGCEMAQTFARLGSQVLLLHRGTRLLPHDDPDAAAIVLRRFESEKIRVEFGVNLLRCERGAAGKQLVADQHGSQVVFECDEVLAGVGRRPNVENLGLEAAGVVHDSHGVRVDDYLRTTNRHILAAGDVCSAYKFTHAADAMARVVIQNALFFGRKRLSDLRIPWCTYTDPEVAHAGLSAADAHERGVELDTFTVPLADVDRARLDGECEGFVRIHVRRGTDRMVGATIVAAHAGEMLGEITLAMTQGIGLSRLAHTIHTYPTQAEAIKRAGDMYQRTRLTPWRLRLLRAWLAWRR